MKRGAQDAFVKIWLGAAASAIIIALFASPSFALDKNDRPLRVGLVQHFSAIQSVMLLASSGFDIIDKSGAKLTQCSNLTPVTATACSGSIMLSFPNDKTLFAGNCIILQPTDATASVSVNSPERPFKQYRGSIEISMVNDRLRLVNIVDAEDYLLGVVPAEMPSTSSYEALKAQAVAARTYAMTNRKKHAKDGYGLCDSTNCQVYEGVGAERNSTTRAIIATEGVVLTYQGKLARTLYSADGGGATQNYQELFPTEDMPYLCGVIDPDGIRRNIWEKTYTLGELETSLAKGGIKSAEGLKDISASLLGSTGRVRMLKIVGKNGSEEVSAGKIQRILGYTVIKSSLYTLKCEEGSVTFSGKGFGHGVGLCQTGAMALAKPPFSYTYDKILAHYFPGTKLMTAYPPLRSDEGKKEYQASVK